MVLLGLIQVIAKVIENTEIRNLKFWILPVCLTNIQIPKAHSPLIYCIV